MIIDVFTYSQATQGAPFNLESLIEAAKCARIDGIAVTDRASSSRICEYEEIAKREGVLVVYGVELQTDAGRVVVYPASLDEDFVNEDWRGLGDCPKVEDVLDYFHQRDGIVIARDVYDRGAGLKERVRSVKDSSGRGFDGVDTLSAYRRRIDNEMSMEAQSAMGIPACAGSGVFDSLEDIGHCATLFSQEIHDQASFVAAMRSATHWAVALRDLGEAGPMGVAPREDSRGREDRPREFHGDRRNSRDSDRRYSHDDRRKPRSNNSHRRSAHQEDSPR